MPQGRVDHSAKLPNFIADLCTSQRLSDVKIKVGEEVFPAHSLILGGQSPYFERKFFTERTKEVSLPFTTAVVFHDVLGYFYTGKIEFQTDVNNYIPELVELAGFLGLQSLQEDVVDDMFTHMLSDEPVPEHALRFYDQDAQVLISKEMFNTLPLNRLQELLSRDTFYVENEVDILKAVMEWGKGRSEDERKAGLSKVRLDLIPQPALDSAVEPAGVFDDTEIQYAIKVQTSAPDDTTRRMPTVKTVPEMNVARPEHGAEVLSGENPEHLLDPTVHTYSLTSGFTSHALKSQGEQEGIVVKLGRVYKLNTIKLHLQDVDKTRSSYYVEVSERRAGPWQRVVDYTQYHCRGHQLLHFDPTPAQYVKLVGTACTQGDVFAVESLQCYFTDTPLAVTQSLIEPRENQALEERGALVLVGRGGGMIQPLYEHYTSGQYITMISAQPVYISNMRFHLFSKGWGSNYRYTVEASIDGKTWHQLVDRSHIACDSWQSLTFDKTPVSYLRFNCTEAINDDNSITITVLEYPDQNL